MPTRPKPPTNLIPVLLGGFALALAAGFVNVVVIAEGGRAVTHVTGSISALSDDLAHGVFDHAASVGLVVLAFAIGAAGSGMIVGDAALSLGRPYGIAVVLEGLLLVASGLVIRASPETGMALAAAAAGLQNGCASAYRGMVVRTTHLTGILTDLGFLAGCAVRSRRIAGWRFAMLAGLLVSFAAGGLAGALAHDVAGRWALVAMGVLMLVSGGAFFAWRMGRTTPDAA